MLKVWCSPRPANGRHARRRAPTGTLCGVAPGPSSRPPGASPRSDGRPFREVSRGGVCEGPHGVGDHAGLQRGGVRDASRREPPGPDLLRLRAHRRRRRLHRPLGPDPRPARRARYPPRGRPHRKRRRPRGPQPRARPRARHLRLLHGRRRLVRPLHARGHGRRHAALRARAARVRLLHRHLRRRRRGAHHRGQVVSLDRVPHAGGIPAAGLRAVRPQPALHPLEQALPALAHRGAGHPLPRHLHGRLPLRARLRPRRRARRRHGGGLLPLHPRARRVRDEPLAPQPLREARGGARLDALPLWALGAARRRGEHGDGAAPLHRAARGLHRERV